MRAAVGVGNRVGEAEDLVVVTVVVLHHAIHEHFVLLPAITIGLGCSTCLFRPSCRTNCSMPSLYRKVSVFLVPLVLRTISTPGIQEGQLPQRMASMSNLNSVVIVKMVGSGLKVIKVPVGLACR